MWRLISPRRQSSERRTPDERGVTAVVVALVMVLLLGFCAIALDVAALFAERQKLQLGADAAALAVARDCAAGDCGTYNATAQKYVTDNSTAPGATGSVLTSGLDPSTGQVRVQADATTDHWFAPVLGINQTSQSVQAAAKWGAPVGGRAILPLTFSLCEWSQFSPSVTQQIVVYNYDSDKARLCKDKTGKNAPGGFGWLEPDSTGVCTLTSKLDDWLSTESGKSASCKIETSLHGVTVLLPIFDKTNGLTGTNVKYHVVGYAAFTITGYRFPGKEWNKPCSSPDTCISGYFKEFVASSDWELGTGGLDYGARIVTLSD